MPHAYVIAGSNGAGKTTFVRQFLPRYASCREFLNADLMAAGISPFDPDAAAVAAARTLLARMKELIRHGKNFGFETTLAGKTYLSILRDMRERGYRTHLFYLWLPDVDMAIARVAERVEEGGHNVPEAAVRRRFEVGPQNLRKLYVPLFDTWMLFDNSMLHPRRAAWYDGKDLRVLKAELYERVFGPTQENEQ
jgi:predicted ABC-type ATPase